MYISYGHTHIYIYNPMADINYHKQHKFIILKFFKSESNKFSMG